MRHAPTSLYIDTEFFRRNNLRLDTREFSILKDTFVKGGIRLLTPKLMERELFRHYEIKAKKVADKLAKAYNDHPVRYLLLGDLPPQEELKRKCLTELKRQWEAFKEHFVVQELPLVGSLEDVVNWYLEIKAPFSEKKRKEFPDAFILSALEHYHREHKANIAVVTADGGFREACQMRPYIAWYESVQKYTEAFEPAQSAEDLQREPIDPTQPIVTEDLTELRAILGRGSSVTAVEVGRALELLRSRGENYRYFFLNCRDLIWLGHLKQAGYFKSPPNGVVSADGEVQYPFWPELQYLRNVCKDDPDKVIEIVLQLPRVDNPRVYDDILDIALELEGNQSGRLKPKMLEYAGLKHQFLPYKYPKLLAHWTAGDEIEAALELADMLVQFAPDPQAEEKQKRRRENPDDWTTSLSPAPRIYENYPEILNEGVRPLAKKEPYQVARILIDATASMIRLTKHEEDLGNGESRDSSEIWCPRLNKQRRNYRDSRETLVQTLTYACEKVYCQVASSIEALDRSLRNQRWAIFRRLRQHLYALHPGEQTRPWIRELILAHGDYAKWVHHYEFQQMIRLACEHFGAEMLTEEERTQILDSILSGPPKEDFREWRGEQFSEADFEKRQRNFHLRQLRPFAPVLFGEYAGYFQELKNDETADEITDESYLLFSESKGGSVTFRSPRSRDELSKLSDEELLNYTNEWQDEHRDEDDWLIEINIEALGGAFQAIFKDSIIPDDERLEFWIEKTRERIERPIYVRMMVNAMEEHAKGKNFGGLERWLGFCQWVISHPDEDREEPIRHADTLRTNPSWRSSRRAVGDFVGTCLEENVNAPISAREQIAELLDGLCTQFDRYLDQDEPVRLNQDDQLTKAIDAARGRALDNLVKFGLWVRRHNDTDNAPEVTSILEKRFKADAEYPLTMPEHALLGMNYGNLYSLNQTWAVEHKAAFFPQDNAPVWRKAFGNFLRFSDPYKPTFDIVRDDFEFALEHLDELKKQWADTLGHHLFTYYLWEVYPLTGDESLLQHFYREINGERKHWARLFSNIGRSLRNTGRYLDKSLKKRIIAFFEWRIEAGEPTELHQFAFWLEAECLEAEWRLKAYSRILDMDYVAQEKHRSTLIGHVVVKALREMLPEHTALVVECFAKLTDKEAAIYQTDHAKAILKAGFEHEDEKVRENARHARENLLHRGHFELLDLND